MRSRFSFKLVEQQLIRCFDAVIGGYLRKKLTITYVDWMFHYGIQKPYVKLQLSSEGNADHRGNPQQQTAL